MRVFSKFELIIKSFYFYLFLIFGFLPCYYSPQTGTFVTNIFVLYWFYLSNIVRCIYALNSIYNEIKRVGDTDFLLFFIKLLQIIIYRLIIFVFCFNTLMNEQKIRRLTNGFNFLVRTTRNRNQLFKAESSFERSLLIKFVITLSLIFYRFILIGEEFDYSLKLVFYILLDNTIYYTIVDCSHYSYGLLNSLLQQELSIIQYKLEFRDYLTENAIAKVPLRLTKILKIKDTLKSLLQGAFLIAIGSKFMSYIADVSNFIQYLWLVAFKSLL